MIDILIYIISAAVFVRTAAYGVWCFKNTGAAGGIAVIVTAILALSPFFVVTL